MVAIQAGPVAIACAIAGLCFLSYAIIRRRHRAERFGRALSHAKPIVSLACIPAGFLLMELPYNPMTFSMEPSFVVAGLGVTAALFAIVFFFGQRSKAAMALFLCACFAAGTANYFVALFKGQPILPSDVMALQTAASVSGGYVYVVGDSVLFAFGLLAALGGAIAVLPASKPTKRSVAIDMSAGAAIMVAFAMWFAAVDIEKDYGCSVDVWSSLDSYQQHGSLLCFLQRSQLIAPQAPEDYSPQEAAAIKAEKAAIALAEQAVEDAPATAPDVRPAVVAIMNETFSDLSRYPNVAQTYEGTVLFDEIDALVKGDCYVSAMGGGTCNSEFEFLTGSTMGMLGAGVYPYMLYDLSGADNLARHLSSIGYKTSAIHPAQKENWRRDRVYAQLGFDEFYDIDSFDNPEMFRGMVSDAATYDLILDLLRQDDTPQFVFDVTIASHGGYDTGSIPTQDMVHAPLDGVEYDDVNEYLSCIERSQAELKAFLDELRELDRPVIVCFFGDHQPGFVEWLAGEAYGSDEDGAEENEGIAATQEGSMPDGEAAETASDERADGAQDAPSEIELVQERYVTPYLIWTNSPELRRASDEPHVVDTSLNYLGAILLRTAGLPLDEYFAFTLAMREDIPAINLNGYQDAEGTWRWHGESSESSDAYRQLSMVEHANLFERE